MPILLVLCAVTFTYALSMWLFAHWQGTTIWEFLDIPIWEYGQCRDRQARRHKLTSRVQFAFYDQHRNTHWYPCAFKYWREFRINDLHRPNRIGSLL